ncbi:YceD family protein [Hahella sp. SMD15-11]|uniref:Large ribosomal RNA subunit accumulation protein YceD n=1 Tax=Thermohahella caldifontis TaxID=3142973 RepID=A0AB39UYL3_9GAMM
MIKQSIPDRLDVRRACEAEHQYSVTFPLSRLVRVVEAVEPGSHERLGEQKVQAELRFSRDESGWRRMAGQVVAEVPRICQRCLEPMMTRVEGRISVAFALTDEEARQVPRECEPMLLEQHLDVVAALEEEILLAMPLHACHDDDRCHAVEVAEPVQESAEETADNPFAVLRTLLGD